MAERTNIFEALNIENGEDIGEGSHVAHQQHPSPVPSSGATFQRPSECAFTSPDPPAHEVPITADGTEEPGGTATEGVQTLGGVASLSPARPANSSSPKKRRAENKNFGLDTRARQPDYSENSIVLEYYQMLIEKERKEMEMAAEKHRLAVERDGLAIERERLAMEKDRLAMEKDQQLIDIGKQVVRCIAFSTEAVEVIKQKFEAELKENRKL